MFGWLTGTKHTEGVEVSAQKVTLHLAPQVQESISWRDVDQVFVVIKSGLSVWILQGEQNLCMVPFGLLGESKLRQTLIDLPAFNYDLLIKEIGKDFNEQKEGKYLLWNRQIS
jgi:hypothetical protein